MTALRFYDFFAGVGLVGLGLAPDWACVWANDIDAKKRAIYDANFPCPDRYLLGDVTRVSAAALPSPVEMAWASFPCQDLSLAGWRRGITGARSGVFWAFHRIMRELHDAGRRPPLVVIENVTGLLYGDNFAGLCEALAELDLQFGALVIDAKPFVPQSRPRVFVTGVDADLDVEPLTERCPAASAWFPRAVQRAHQALPPDLQARWRWWRLPEPAAAPPSARELIEPEPSGVRWHAATETARLLALMAPAHLTKIERALASGRREIGFLYKRTRKDGQRAEVRFDGVAGCLRTTYGGSSRQTVVIVEEGEVRSRLLSPREAARLMGVPDSFQLPARYNDAYRAMGDGVAVPVAGWLGRHLLTPLAIAARGFG